MVKLLADFITYNLRDSSVFEAVYNILQWIIII